MNSVTLQRSKAFFNRKIRNKLTITYVIPVFFLFTLFGIWVYFQTFKALEMEMSKRLIAIANTVGAELQPDRLRLLQSGDEDTRFYLGIRNKLLKIKEQNQVRKIYIFTTDNQSLVDTDDQIPIGFKYAQNAFVRNELKDVVERGLDRASVLFEGRDGNMYKTGFSYIGPRDGSGLIIGVDGNADFYDILKQLRRNIFLVTLIGIGSVLLLSIIFSKSIVYPINKLVVAATKIGEGQLDSNVTVSTNDEIGFLSHKFNEMRNSILERDQRMQMMLHGIAHEVRNPLGGIGVFSELLEEELSERPDALEYVKKIKKETVNLQNIVNEFLDFAHPIPIEKKNVEFPRYLSDIAMFFQAELLSRGIMFKQEISKTLEEIRLDPENMKRVFYNLFRNSIQAMPRGGEICIRGRLEEALVRSGGASHKKVAHIYFSDNGCGIEPKNLAQLFTPFFTTKEKGSGLGLAFVKKIVENHGGEVLVSSQEHQGTTVHLSLPQDA